MLIYCTYKINQIPHQLIHFKVTLNVSLIKSEKGDKYNYNSVEDLHELRQIIESYAI